MMVVNNHKNDCIAEIHKAIVEQGVITPIENNSPNSRMWECSHWQAAYKNKKPISGLYSAASAMISWSEVWNEVKHRWVELRSSIGPPQSHQGKSRGYTGQAGNDWSFAKTFYYNELANIRYGQKGKVCSQQDSGLLKGVRRCSIWQTRFADNEYIFPLFNAEFVHKPNPSGCGYDPIYQYSFNSFCVHGKSCEG